jgi:hypothetical protein
MGKEYMSCMAEFNHIMIINCTLILGDAGEGRKVFRVLVGKPKGKRPLERSRHRRDDGIRMDVREIGWVGVEWIHLAQEGDWWQAVVNALMNLQVLAPWS